MPASACALCLGGLRFAPGLQVDVAEQAVLAAPVADGKHWRVVEVVKGPALAGRVIAGPVDGAEDAATRAGRPVLLLDHEQWLRWSAVGPIGDRYAGWLRRLAATGPTADRTDVDWRGLAEPPPLRPDPPLDKLAALRKDTDLAFLLVHVDANIVHGWPLLGAPLSAFSRCGALYATTLSGGSAASSDLRSAVDVFDHKLEGVVSIKGHRR
jgi:hypothetical protein